MVVAGSISTRYRVNLAYFAVKVGNFLQKSGSCPRQFGICRFSFTDNSQIVTYNPQLFTKIRSCPRQFGICRCSCTGKSQYVTDNSQLFTKIWELSASIWDLSVFVHGQLPNRHLQLPNVLKKLGFVGDDLGFVGNMSKKLGFVRDMLEFCLLKKREKKGDLVLGMQSSELCKKLGVVGKNWEL